MFFTCFLMCLHASALFAGTYYVSHTGTATWNQSTNIDSPCSAETALANAVAGDIVYFRGGTYDPVDTLDWNMPAWNPSNSGTDSNPITFQAYPGETPIVLAKPVSPSFGSNGKNYIVWDGFKGPGKLGIQLYVRFFQADHCTIQNCEIKGYDQGTALENNPCISAKFASYLTIKNCKLYGNQGGGHNSANILFYSVDHAVVENCDIYDAYAGIFDKDGGQYNTYRYNRIYDVDIGFLLGTESGGPNPTEIKVYQNLFLNIGKGIAVGIGGSKPKTNLYIYNNTILSSIKIADGISYWTSGAINVIEVYNNIISGFNRNVIDSNNHSSIYSNYSCFIDFNKFRRGNDRYYSLSEWTAGTGYDGNSIDSNPKFQNVGSYNPDDDYHLQATSPCIGTGRNGEDMGVYPNGNDSKFIGSWLGNPRAPRNLRISK